MASTDELKQQQDAAKLQLVKATLAIARFAEMNPSLEAKTTACAAFLSSPAVLWALGVAPERPPVPNP